MASITIRRLPEPLKARLRVRAAQHGRSMEEEVRQILGLALSQNTPGASLVDCIRGRIAPLGGVELEIPPREPLRQPPELGG